MPPDELFQAMASPDHDRATALVESNRSLIHTRSSDGCTPLHVACRWGRTELVELLLERSADAIEMDAESWATPKAWAQKMRHPEVLSLLQE